MKYEDTIASPELIEMSIDAAERSKRGQDDKYRQKQDELISILEAVKRNQRPVIGHLSKYAREK